MLYYLLSGQGKESPSHRVAGRVPQVAWLCLPADPDYPCPQGQPECQKKAPANELFVPATGRTVEGLPAAIGVGGDGCGFRPVAPRLPAADGGGPPQGAGNEGTAGTAPAGEVGIEGLSHRVPPSHRTEPGREPPLGAGAAGGALRRGGQRPDPRLLHHNRQSRGPALSGRCAVRQRTAATAVGGFGSAVARSRSATAGFGSCSRSGSCSCSDPCPAGSSDGCPCWGASAVVPRPALRQDYRQMVGDVLRGPHTRPIQSQHTDL